MSITYSPLQASIFDAIKSSDDSLLIEGVAGCGKSFTIEHAVQFIPSPSAKLIVSLAFNKRIADELEKRLPRFVQCGTFHKRALAALSRVLPRKAKMDGDKVYKILEDGLMNPKHLEIYARVVIKLVSLMKNYGLEVPIFGETKPASSSNVWAIIENNAITLDSEEGEMSQAVEYAIAAFDASNSDLSVIDFDDMLYLAVRLRARFDLASYLFIDEAQDTNAIQMELLTKMLKPGGRLIAVGDHNQAIYGFRGAGVDSMDVLAHKFNMRRMPLDICYRCSKAVVTHVRSDVRKGSSTALITSHPDAPEGQVTTLSSYDKSLFTPTTTILCRLTSPLISFAFQLIRRTIACRVLGREIGQSLIALVKRMNVTEFDHLEGRLSQYLARETKKFEARNDFFSADAVRDRVECIMIFIQALSEDERSVDTLCRRIDALFTDTASGAVTLSTVHKAKGLEWETVCILDKKKYMPYHRATKPWQIEQEYNLIYVARTRAKINLFYIESGTWKEPAPKVTIQPTIQQKLTLED